MAQETEAKQLCGDTLDAGVRSLIRDAQKGFYLVADIDGQTVGALMVTFEWSDWRDGLFWWLQSVYVRPQYRRQGVFRALYKYLEQMAHPDPRVPRKLKTPSESPWLIQYAGKQGTGIPRGGPATEVLLNVFKQGDTEERLAALPYLKRVADDGIIGALAEISRYYTGSGERTGPPARRRLRR